jgi:hypothetical protein
VLGSVLEPVVGVELLKEIFTFRARWMPLIVEWNTSANMFYLLKNILLLIMVIFKLKCNNLIFNEIMILNASYVCLHAFSLHWESPNLDPERWTPYFRGGSVTSSPSPHAFLMASPRLVRRWITVELHCRCAKEDAALSCCGVIKLYRCCARGGGCPNCCVLDVFLVQIWHNLDAL